MNGDLLMKVLICEYAIISVVYLFEQNYFKSMYWLGALIITVSVLMMK